MKTIKAALVVFFAMTFSLAMQAKKVELRYTLEKGFEICFELTSAQEIAQEVMGQSQSTQTRLVMATKFKVLDITPDGNYLMTRVITKVKIMVSSPMGDMEFDTDNIEDDNPLAGSLSWLKDAPLEFVMSPSGEILEVKDADKVAEEFTEKTSGGGPESQMIMALASQFTSEDGLKQSISMSLLKYPIKKVKVGKPWETVSEIEQLISFVSTTATMVNEINGDLASLTQDVKIEQGEGENMMEMQGMEMEYELSGGKQGAYEVDLKTGLIVKGEGITTISGIVSIDSPQLPAPMSIPMTIKTTETVKRVE
ncbi:MAG: DUF6263 family protein [Bacteroidota bacterium]|nr:DUF6263 family protein [Bacteroidota bacterium]